MKILSLFIKLFKRILLAQIVFIKEILSNPRLIGAFFPSSQSLAKSMVTHIPQKSSGYIIELGAGTGSITKQILSSGIEPKRLIVIEISPRFVKYLKENFPEINIIQGSAEQLDLILGDKIHHIDAIISSLPLKSLPKHVVKNIHTQVSKTLSNEGLYIQYTYKIFEDNNILVGMKSIYSNVIWKNLPPASVNVLQKNLFYEIK